MPKILHVISSLTSGGAERQLVEVLKYFDSRQDFVSELIVMSDDIHYEYVNDLKVKVHIIKRKYKKDVSVFFKFYHLMKEIKPDIVHSWNSMCSIYVFLPSKILGLKFVNNHLRNAPVVFNFRHKGWLRSKLTFAFSDVVAANSQAGLEAYAVNEKKGTCLYNGFDFSRISDLDDKEFVRKRFDIHTKYVVGMVASFAERKDYETFIHAAHNILEKRSDVSFVTVGDGPRFEKIQQMIRPKFQHSIKMLGSQKRVLNIVNIFDIGILCTNDKVHGEGIPNVVMEYMALVKPSIVNACGGNEELVENGRTGFLIEARNPSLLADKICFFLENERLRNEMGEEGFKKLKMEFDLDVMGKRFMDLYRRLMAGR